MTSLLATPGFRSRAARHRDLHQGDAAKARLNADGFRRAADSVMHEEERFLFGTCSTVEQAHAAFHAACGTFWGELVKQSGPKAAAASPEALKTLVLEALARLETQLGRREAEPGRVA